MVAAALMSSVKHSWQTPSCVLERVRDIAPIAMDPCTTPDNPVGAERFIAPPDCGLRADWGDGLCFVNPPFGRGIGAWVAKCSGAMCDGANVVLLLPARTDTAWFRAAWGWSSAVCLWRGRMTFVGAEAGAPFPSALFFMGTAWRRFQRAFDDAGIVVIT